MKTKLILCDFDGTITKYDVLDALCGLNKKEKESQQIDYLFQLGQKDGQSALIERFSLLEGLAMEAVYPVLEKVELNEGAEALFAYARNHGIKVHVLSGNSTFVLEYFAKKFGFSKYSGSELVVEDGVICRWDACRCVCVDKYAEALDYIQQLKLRKDEIIAVGDSVADEQIFSLAGTTFLINKKGNITADYNIERLDEIIPYIN